MQIFDRYILKSLFIATGFTTATLAGVIMLTQSLKFLELIINAGASSTTFWILSLMALPRFLEIILPIALMAATVFVYNRMTADSELAVMRATGSAPLQLARPALTMAGLVTLLMLLITMWVAPLSQRDMQQMRQVIKAQYSTLLFRDGIFNAVRPGLTVFIRERAQDGTLRGVMIHDSRPENKGPVTILARSGVLVSTSDGQQVVVYNGSRQSVNTETQALEQLNFERYTIDLPEGSGPVRQRWREPDERTFPELFNPDLKNERDRENRHEFMTEAHRRIAGPLLAPAYTVLALLFLLLGPVERRGQMWRVIAAIATCIALQGLYLAASSLARQEEGIGIACLYAVPFLPLCAGLFLLSDRGEAVRRRMILRHDVRGRASA